MKAWCKEITEGATTETWWIYNIHKRANEITGIQRKKILYIIRKADGKLTLNADEIKEEWIQYICQLFEDNREDDIVCESNFNEFRLIWVS